MRATSQSPSWKEVNSTAELTAVCMLKVPENEKETYFYIVVSLNALSWQLSTQSIFQCFLIKPLPFSCLVWFFWLIMHWLVHVTIPSNMYPIRLFKNIFKCRTCCPVPTSCLNKEEAHQTTEGNNNINVISWDLYDFWTTCHPCTNSDRHVSLLYTYIVSDTQVYDSVMANVMKEIAEMTREKLSIQPKPSWNRKLFWHWNDGTAHVRQYKQESTQ